MVARYASGIVSSANFINLTLTAHFAVSGPDALGGGSGFDTFIAESSAAWSATSLAFVGPPPYPREFYEGNLDFTVSGFLAAGDTIQWIFNCSGGVTGFPLHGDQTVTTPGSFSQSFFVPPTLVSSSGYDQLSAGASFSAVIYKGTGGGTSFIDLDPSISVTVVPEPATLVLSACALAVLALVALRRRTAVSTKC